jgi:signal transduction histidine kinase/CheY-like chemotaxis protein
VALGELWLMFCQAQCQCIVVVNPQDHPQGLVFLHRLLPYLFPSGFQVHPSKVEINPLVLQQTLETQQEGLVEPLQVLPHHLNASELENYLQSLQQTQTHQLQTIPTVAVVNQSGQFLGLLDIVLYWQTWAKQRPEAGPSSTDHLSQTIAPFLQNLLEQFPVPLMIQQENGTVILQNWAWQSRLRTGSDTVRQTSETVVHFSPNPPPSSDPPLNPLPSWCQLGPQPDTYICICSAADDQEQVWQFTRQPLQSQWSEVFLPQSPSQPSPQLWLVLAQDITEQHRVSQELAAKNADLVHLNRLKDEFLACISHELKSPLTAILGLSKLLNEPLLGSLNERQAHYAQLIYQSGRHLMMVVNDILDLTRIETGQLELSPGSVQIRAVCQQGFAMAVGQQQEQSQSPTYRNLSEALEQRITEAQQRFTLEIDPGLDGLVADELRLRQMLAHLISNALKFTPKPRKLGLRVSLWDHWIAFTVWDEGIGIPEDKQHLIFQKFQQLQSPLTREYQGTGLGLVLTQRLAHLHGGDVSFISQAGLGSQFTLLLPPSPPQVGGQFFSNLPQPQVCPQSTVPSRLVLIVEAVPRFIHHLSEQLNQIGYQVVIARSGTEALEKARCLQPHVIFLNPLLPLLSGWDVLTLLKTDQKTHQIPVIITATLGDKKRAIQNDSNGFLCLPVQPAELQKTLAIIDQKPLPQTTQKLTILWLNPIEEQKKSELPTQNTVAIPTQHSSWILHHSSCCRILEADDLIQAELLGRIWQPDVMILQSLSGVQSPSSFLEQLTQHEGLANLPLITLDAFTTEQVNQLEQLSVFPCLINSLETKSDSAIESALLQVIQIATGGNHNRKGSILVVDLLTLSQSLDNHAATGLELQSKIDHALIHYLETAGFRSLMGHSWPETIQSIQSQTVDLLLICTQDCTSAVLNKGLNWIKNIEVSIPILIWQRSEDKQSFSQIKAADQSLPKNHSGTTQVSAIPVAEMQQLIEQLGIQVLPPETSIVELLKTIRQCFQMHH